MKAKRPNINSPEWDLLKNSLGEDQAYLAYIRNNDEMPDIMNAGRLLSYKDQGGSIIKPPTGTLIANINKYSKDYPGIDPRLVPILFSKGDIAGQPNANVYIIPNKYAGNDAKAVRDVFQQLSDASKKSKTPRETVLRAGYPDANYYLRYPESNWPVEMVEYGRKVDMFLADPEYNTYFSSPNTFKATKAATKSVIQRQRGGTIGDPPKGTIPPYTTSDPFEYASRKKAYNDSLAVWQRYELAAPKGTVHQSFDFKQYFTKPEYEQEYNKLDKHSTELDIQYSNILKKANGDWNIVNNSPEAKANEKEREDIRRRQDFLKSNPDYGYSIMKPRYKDVGKSFRKIDPNFTERGLKPIKWDEYKDSGTITLPLEYRTKPTENISTGEVYAKNIDFPTSANKLSKEDLIKYMKPQLETNTQYKNSDNTGKLKIINDLVDLYNKNKGVEITEEYNNNAYYPRFKKPVQPVKLIKDNLSTIPSKPYQSQNIQDISDNRNTQNQGTTSTQGDMTTYFANVQNNPDRNILNYWTPQDKGRQNMSMNDLMKLPDEDVKNFLDSFGGGYQGSDYANYLETKNKIQGKGTASKKYGGNFKVNRKANPVLMLSEGGNIGDPPYITNDRLYDNMGQPLEKDDPTSRLLSNIYTSRGGKGFEDSLSMFYNLDGIQAGGYPLSAGHRNIRTISGNETMPSFKPLNVVTDKQSQYQMDLNAANKNNIDWEHTKVPINLAKKYNMRPDQCLECAATEDMEDTYIYPENFRDTKSPTNEPLDATWYWGTKGLSATPETIIGNYNTPQGRKDMTMKELMSNSDEDVKNFFDSFGGGYQGSNYDNYLEVKKKIKSKETASKKYGGNLNFNNMNTWEPFDGYPTMDEFCPDCHQAKMAALFNNGGPVMPYYMTGGNLDLETLKKGGNWLGKASKKMKKKGTKGSFTKYCGGKVTDECISKGLNSSDPTTRKRAAFAKAMRHIHKKAMGGEQGAMNWDKNDIVSQKHATFINHLVSNKDSFNLGEMVDKYMDTMDHLEKRFQDGGENAQMQQIEQMLQKINPKYSLQVLLSDQGTFQAFMQDQKVPKQLKQAVSQIAQQAQQSQEQEQPQMQDGGQNAQLQQLDQALKQINPHYSLQLLLSNEGLLKHFMNDKKVPIQLKKAVAQVIQQLQQQQEQQGQDQGQQGAPQEQQGQPQQQQMQQPDQGQQMQQPGMQYGGNYPVPSPFMNYMKQYGVDPNGFQSIVGNHFRGFSEGPAKIFAPVMDNIFDNSAKTWEDEYSRNAKTQKHKRRYNINNSFEEPKSEPVQQLFSKYGGSTKYPWLVPNGQFMQDGGDTDTYQNDHGFNKGVNDRGVSIWGPDSETSPEMMMDTANAMRQGTGSIQSGNPAPDLAEQSTPDLSSMTYVNAFSTAMRMHVKNFIWKKKVYAATYGTGKKPVGLAPKQRTDYGQNVFKKIYQDGGNNNDPYGSQNFFNAAQGLKDNNKRNMQGIMNSFMPMQNPYGMYNPYQQFAPGGQQPFSNGLGADIDMKPFKERTPFQLPIINNYYNQYPQQDYGYQQPNYYTPNRAPMYDYSPQFGYNQMRNSGYGDTRLRGIFPQFNFSNYDPTNFKAEAVYRNAGLFGLGKKGAGPLKRINWSMDLQGKNNQKSNSPYPNNIAERSVNRNNEVNQPLASNQQFEEQQSVIPPIMNRPEFNGNASNFYYNYGGVPRYQNGGFNMGQNFAQDAEFEMLRNNPNALSSMQSKTINQIPNQPYGNKQNVSGSLKPSNPYNPMYAQMGEGALGMAGMLNDQQMANRANSQGGKLALGSNYFGVDQPTFGFHGFNGGQDFNAMSKNMGPGVYGQFMGNPYQSNSMKQGGEYNLSEKEIMAILAAGGEIEYID